MSSSVPVYEISLPEYTVEREPDFLAIGARLDPLIEAHFPERWIAIRGIGLVDHPGWALDDLVATIRELGTDRYDPQRKGVHEDFYQFPVDVWAGPCLVSNGLHAYEQEGPSVMAELVDHFYGGTKADRGYSIRLDIILIYDLDQLEPISLQRTPDGPVPLPVPRLPTESYAFNFKHPEQKRNALLGIVKILR
jgi:hypothetical protein